MADHIREKEGDLPLVLYGHSLGGGIGLNYLVNTNNNMEAGIITSPWLKLGFDPPPFKLMLASALRRILPSLALSSGLDPDDLSSDKDIVRAYINDPLNHSRVSPGLFISAMRNAEALLNCNDRLRVPVLLMHGEKDRIASFNGSETFARNNSMAKLKIWKEGYHELHNDVFADEVRKYLFNWLERKYEIQNSY